MPVPPQGVKANSDILARAGLDEPAIERLVRAFYGKVRTDDLLGPIFEAKIQNWEPHLARMVEFWSSVALMSGRYHGLPMPKHVNLPVEARHFDRWLQLFGEAARETSSVPAADFICEKARRIAESLQLGIAMNRGLLLRKSERLRGEERGDERRTRIDSSQE